MGRSKIKYPTTPATRFLKNHRIEYTSHLYDYELSEGSSVAQAAANALGIEQHEMVKTIVLVDHLERPLIVLMHGDCTINTGELARQLSCKKITPCRPEQAQRISGYQVGGTSPFGTRKEMPVYMEQTILDLEYIYINAGKRGYLIKMTPQDVVDALHVNMVQVAVFRDS